MKLVELIDALDKVIMAAGAERDLLCEVGGFPLYAYRLVRQNSERSVYLSAGVHGDEPAGPLALLELVKGGLLGAPCSWYICPLLNPTGMAVGTRENAEGVDLNRDYLKQRTVEVKSHVAWLDGKVLDFAISLHEDWESTGFYFYEINQVEDRPQRYKRMVEAVSSVMPMEPNIEIDDHKVRELGWIYHRSEADEPSNWPEAIFLAKQGCPLSFTFETPSAVALELRVSAHQRAVRAALKLCVVGES